MIFTIKVWSRVRLKSNGTEMIATSCLGDKEGNESYTCKWQDAEGHLNMADFPLEELDAL